ncbi:MAG: autotransporter outer membrane beta-barrel domain-containing protein [Campylobacteraceae bacterium]|jgi:outer membrane autotransporter protein|nr:autotransporter outer membrane beta-barrel domain-containing protein [Campylobacteraceae bacterium]
MYRGFILSKINVLKETAFKAFSCLLLPIVFSANLFAECSTGASVFCDVTVDANVYHNTTLDISNADYLSVEPGNGFRGIANIDNGTWIFDNDNINISTRGNNADAVFAKNATINLHGTLHVDTNGSNAGAIYVLDNSTINLNNDVFINTNGNYTYAVAASNDSTINFNNNVLLNSFGAYSNAFYAQNAVINMQEATTINVFGDNSHAFSATNNALINLSNNSTVNVTGNNSYAFAASYYSNIFLGNNSLVSTSGEHSYALFAYENSNITFNGNAVINVTGTDSYAMVADKDSNIGTDDFVRLNIQGDILSNNSSIIELKMSDGSSFIGNTYVQNSGKINLAFDGSDSLWQINDSSVLTNLHVTNGAKIDLTKADILSTMTIANLYGNNGIFYLNVNVNNGNLTGNKITINNSSSGNYQIIIDDSTTGSIANVERQLVLIEQQNGTLSNYNANFTLNSGSVDIGQYIYTLNASNNTNDKNFYLATDGKLNNVALSSIGFLNINYFTNYLAMQTLLQRMGELRNKQDIQNDIWIKINAGKADSFDKALNIADVNYYGITAGVDNVYGVDSGSILIGMFVDLLKADIKYKKGDGKGDSKAAGIYVTYKNNNDFYVDFISKYSSNNNEFQTQTSGGFEINGNGEAKGFSAALESAKRIFFGNFYIEPELALTYSHQSSFTMNNMALGSFNSIIGRASALVGYQLRNTNIYLKSGYIKEFDGKTFYAPRDDNSQKHDYNLDGNFWDNAVGVAMDFKNRHLYMEGTYQKGNNFNNQKINLGYRFIF